MGLFLDGTNSKIYNDVWHNIQEKDSSNRLEIQGSSILYYIAKGTKFSIECEWTGGEKEYFSISHAYITAEDFNIECNTSNSIITIIFINDIKLSLLENLITFDIKFKNSDIKGFLTLQFKNVGSSGIESFYVPSFTFTQGALGTTSVDLGDKVTYTSTSVKLSKTVPQSIIDSFTVDTANVKGHVSGYNYDWKEINYTFAGGRDVTYSMGTLKFGQAGQNFIIIADLVFSNKQFILSNFRGEGGESINSFRLDNVPIVYNYGYTASVNSWDILKYYNASEDGLIWFNNNTKINGFLTVTEEVK